MWTWHGRRSRERPAYQVLRSLVPGGGYELVATTGDASFADTTVRNGAPSFYVVTALDEVGNVSGRSPETVALPQVSITAVEALGDARRATARTAVGDGTPLEARIILATGDSTDAMSGVTVQVGLGPVGSRPDGSQPDAAWSWFAAQPVGTDEWLGYVRPEDLGTFGLAVRASADGGATWVVDTRTGTDTDTGAPITLDVCPAPMCSRPRHPRTCGWSMSGTITSRSAGPTWTPTTSSDTWCIDLRPTPRDRHPSRPPQIPIYSDTSVVTGTRYDYAITAQDLAFNESLPSPTLTVDAADRVVQVTFRVSVPPGTPATDGLYIAGDFQDWAPGQTPMTRVDERTWSITLPFLDGTSIEYKYTRGSWEAVEKDDGCGEIANRTMTADFGTSREQFIEDVVSKWRDVDGCG